MQILTKLLGNAAAKPGRADGVNLWRQWVSNPKAIRWLLRDEDVLGPTDTALVQGWSERMLEWGMHVEMHAGVSGLNQMVEVFGPDLATPHVLLYRVGDEIQVDEYHGASRRCADMAEALEFVADHT